MPRILSFAAGLLFGIGLLVAGMTRPEKVIGFLDIGADWDPSLAFVMVGGIAVYATLMRLIRAKRQAPLFDRRFHLPTRSDIDPRLVLGAAIFGIGWGLAGYCPGPGLVSLGAGGRTALAFVIALTAGNLLHRFGENLWKSITSTTPRPTP